MQHVLSLDERAWLVDFALSDLSTWKLLNLDNLRALQCIFETSC